MLYRIASGISAAGCNIEVVLIDTEAHRAIDVFYITKDGRKLTDGEGGANRRGVAGKHLKGETTRAVRCVQAEKDGPRGTNPRALEETTTYGRSTFLKTQSKLTGHSQLSARKYTGVDFGAFSDYEYQDYPCAAHAYPLHSVA